MRRSSTFAAPAVCSLFAVPFLLWQNSWFEWANSLWLLEVQTAHVKAHWLPTFFVHAPGQVFYPHHMFYGGALLSVLAYPAAVVGAWPVFVGSVFASFAAATAGISWMARSLGCPSRWADFTGVLFCTSTYLLADLYGRGAWAELVAVSATAVAVGAATAIAVGGRRSFWTFVVLAAATATVAGSHNLTLLVTSVVAPLILLLVIATTPTKATFGSIGLTVAAVAIGLAVCGGFLVPNLVHADETQAAQDGANTGYLLALADYHAPEVVLSPIPKKPAGRGHTSDLYTQVSVATGAVVFVAAWAAFWNRHLRLLHAAGAMGLVGVAGILIALIVNPKWWVSWPATVQAIQFPLRLIPYVTLALVSALAALVRLRQVRERQYVQLALVLAVVWQAGWGVYQVTSSEPRAVAGVSPVMASEVHAAPAPPAFAIGYAQPEQFKFVTKTVLPRPDAQVVLPDQLVRPPSFMSVMGTHPEWSLIATNVVWSPYVRVHGNAAIVGADQKGMVVLRVRSVDEQGAWRASIKAECDGACLIGRGITAAGLLLAVTAAALFEWRRTRLGALGPNHSRTIGSVTSQ